MALALFRKKNKGLYGENFTTAKISVVAFRKRYAGGGAGGGGGKTMEAEGETEGEEQTGSGLFARQHIRKRMLIGSGIAMEREPQYKQFGKYVIDWNKLRDEDILLVKYQCLGKIPNFKQVNITDIFKEFIVELVSSGKVNRRVYDMLGAKERHTFEQLAVSAGIFHKLDIKRCHEEQEDEDEKRFDILRGEVMAG